MKDTVSHYDAGAMGGYRCGHFDLLHIYTLIGGVLRLKTLLFHVEWREKMRRRRSWGGRTALLILDSK